MLARVRLFEEMAGVDMAVLTYRPRPDWPQVRDQLIAEGAVHAGVQLANLYDDLRDADLTGRQPVGGRLAPTGRRTARVDVGPDGHPWRTVYGSVRHRGSVAFADYQRPDGTVFLRAPGADGPGELHPYQLVDRSGAVVASWPRLGGIIRHWVRGFAPTDEPVFVITDSRHTARHLARLRPSRFHVIEQVHNPHTLDDRRWDRRLAPGYEQIFTLADTLAGLVTLTDRQRGDIAARRGATNNLFTIPNPVDPVGPEQDAAVVDQGPDTASSARFVVLARLRGQKRLRHALRAFARVHSIRPETRLDIYGDGRARGPLEALATRLGIERATTFHGYVSTAREQLAGATALLVTSRHEGYPLTVLEALARGCPVISYDIKYGPREQITDGVDGFLVPAEDIGALSKAMVRLVDDPALVARLGTAGRLKATAHHPREFVRAWQDVLQTVVAQSSRRATITSARLDVAKARRRRISAGVLVVRATLIVDGRGPDLSETGVVSVDAISTETAEIVPLPVSTDWSGDRCVLTMPIRPASVFEQLSTASGTCLVRVRLVWGNAAWQSDLHLGRVGGDSTVRCDRQGRLVLSR